MTCTSLVMLTTVEVARRVLGGTGLESDSQNGKRAFAIVPCIKRMTWVEMKVLSRGIASVGQPARIYRYH